MSEVKIRVATVDDAKALVEIYKPYVEKTAITFEYDVPTKEEFAKRIAHILEKYPYLVAEAAGEIVGYAYAGTFYNRAAYDWSVETTVYVREDQKKSGIGKRLYAELEKALKEQHIINLYACVAYTEKEDEYLTNNSVEFHEHLGYRLIGVFKKCGYKFGRWYDMVWMEKHIGEHEKTPKVVKSFKEVQ